MANAKSPTQHSALSTGHSSGLSGTLYYAKRQAPTLERPAYVLIAVLILVSIGSLMSYAFIASHMNVPAETIVGQAHQRAVRAAHSGIDIAIHHIRSAGATGDGWNDHWGFDGEIITLEVYDASPASGTNQDLVGLEVRRYDDEYVDPADGLTKSQFNYIPDFYKITSIGVARSSQGDNLAFYPIEAVVQIPRTDWSFSNKISSSDGFSYDGALAVVSSCSAGAGAVYIVSNNAYIGGSVFGAYASKIRGAISGDAVYDDQGCAAPGQPDNNGWGYVWPAGADPMILPALTLADFGHDDLSYQIDGVTFQAEEITESLQKAASGPLQLGGGSSKTNPANVLVYKNGTELTLDAKNHSITCVGTIVADTIILTDSSSIQEPPDIDFDLAPAVPGFPSVVCNVLYLEDNAPDAPSRTFIEGPVLIRKHIQTDSGSGATFRGFILSNAADASPPPGRGSYKGTIYVIAEEGDPNQPGFHTRLRINNGVDYDFTPGGRQIEPPSEPQVIRLRGGENDIQFSNWFTDAGGGGHTWPP